MCLSKQTHSFQTSLARYCRTDEFEDIPGASKERAKHYRRLVFNIVCDALAKAYPVAKDILDEDAWKFLIRDFFTHHKCVSPELWKMAKEFFEYVRAKNLKEKINAPFLDDLLLFEWTEIEVFMMEDVNSNVTSIENPLSDTLAINAESRLLKLSFPVFKKEVDVAERGDYYLCCYRDSLTLKVRFAELSPVHVVIIEILKQGPRKGFEVVELANEFFGSSKISEEQGEQLLKQLTKDNIIIGRALHD